MYDVTVVRVFDRIQFSVEIVQFRIVSLLDSQLVTHNPYPIRHYATL